MNLKTLVYLFSSSFTIPEENEESDDWNKGHFFSENSESEQASTIEEENLVSYLSVLKFDFVMSQVFCLTYFVTFSCMYIRLKRLKTFEYFSHVHSLVLSTLLN